MNWTDERVELLKKLWNEGLSASQIAAQLGGVSRNAVIGKVHRLKLSGRGKTTTAAPRSKKVNTVAAAPRPAATQTNGSSRPQATTTIRTATVTHTVGATALQMEYVADAVTERVVRPTSDVVVPISRKLTLLQLSERTCKWPIGDPLNEDFHFCGSESGESSPYCGYHSKLAFQPTAERRRAR
ncbi:GcrA family cell cycle regulator [Brucella rhizosphaerae]|uniref:GcrA cell cycle regulator family protein n=1 Tax=Brucella rhizosphaerae TaxID=571254 RepID=A0A256F508_9HYPH|nr:GcrA family cell cycle regulator [Brucella rhizosphaerae]OYR09928.1 gcrA cell cycle regulator family protein [Brucella rhizosphaerae]